MHTAYICPFPLKIYLGMSNTLQSFIDTRTLTFMFLFIYLFFLECIYVFNRYDNKKN